jgi:hypothetical protein
LGQTWEIALNTCKPFACGIVIHPAINGREIRLAVAHAIGSVQRPMRKERLRAQFVGQAEPVPGPDKRARAWELALHIARCKDLHAFFAASP